MTKTNKPSNRPGAAPRRTHKKKDSGFTLIELMIVVVVIGIIAAIAYPSYMDSVRKSRRADAKTALSDVAARLENFYQNNKSYTDVVTALGYIDVGGNKVESRDALYHISITVTPAGCMPDTCSGYTLSAAAQTKNNQHKDTNCVTMTLNHRGARTPASGCW